MLIRAIDEIAPERKEEIIETLLEALDVVDRRDRAHDYPLDLLSWQGLSPGDAGMRT